MSSSTNPKTILLSGDPLAGEGAVITAAITPGMAVIPAGENVARAGANAISPAFARENELVGNGIDDDYAIGQSCMYYTPRRGDWFYALLGASQTITAGASLSTGANGVLVAATPASQSGDTPFAVAFATNVVARALEAVTTESGETARIKVEIV